jgi:zinc protease
VPTMETLSDRTLTELRAWLEPQFQHGPIEVSMVGDVDLATATDAMAKTLGALPERELRPATEKLVEVNPPAQSGAPMTWTVNPALRQVAVALYWPIEGDPDVFTERRYRLLTNIIEERLRQRVREELGASYVVACRYIVNEGFIGQTFIETYAAVESKRAEEVESLIRREIAAMRREGFTSDEFARSKQPYVAQRLIDLRQNTYWAYTVLRDAQQRPERLTAARNRTDDNRAITQAEVQTLLDKAIHPAAAFGFRTVPYQP